MHWIALIVCATILAGCASDRIRSDKEDVVQLRQILEEVRIDQQTSLLRIPLKHKREMAETEALIRAFWNPLNLKRYGEYYRRNNRYAGLEYLICQTEATIAVSENAYWPNTEYERYFFLCDELGFPRSSHELDEQAWSVLELKRLYPQINDLHSTVLYLTPELKNKLLEFLGEDFTEWGTPSIMSTSQARGISAERLAATDGIIEIFPGHWGEQWHFISHPELEMILFSHDFNHAAVIFRIGYGGGHTQLSKTPSGEWQILESEEYWVE